jgi:hypothetical protein
MMSLPTIGDTLLKRVYLVVTGHHRDGAEFEPLRRMDRADRNPARSRLNFVGQLDG